MVLKISVIAIFIYLLSGCALTNFVSEVKQAIEAKKIANDPNYIGINNPYYQKMQGIKVNVTTKDQVLTILGAPVLLTEHTETSFIGCPAVRGHDRSTLDASPLKGRSR